MAQDNTGNATLKFDDGTECKVGMLNNERNGMGKCSYPKGSMYDGSWKNDMKHGYGKYIPAESSPIASYEGGFVRDKLSGKGMMKYKNNAVYVGEFANDNIKINSKGEIQVCWECLFAAWEHSLINKQIVHLNKAIQLSNTRVVIKMVCGTVLEKSLHLIMAKNR